MKISIFAPSINLKQRTMKRIFIISVLCTLMGLTKTMAQEAYAVYTSDNTTLTFYYDNQKSSRSGIKYSVPLNQTDDDDPAWFSKVGETTTVKFDPSFAGARPTNTNSWFSAMYKLTTITGMEYFNTSQVTSMSYMFSLSRNLRSLDLTHFNTAKVKKMVRMFWGCEKLVTICVGDGWTTNAITNSEEMFTGCHELVGGNGTKYDDMHPLHSRAQIDGKDGYAGYFTSAEYTSLTYNLWVGGIQVTYMNKDDILNTGQAAYNPSTNTLTLKGQYINGKGTSSDAATGCGAGIYSQVNGLTIDVVSGTKVTGANGCSGMLLINNTTITGPGKLTLSMKTWHYILIDPMRGSRTPHFDSFTGISFMGAKDTLTIANANITITSDNGESVGITGNLNNSATSLLIVKDSYLHVEGGVSKFNGGITLDGCKIIEPKEGRIQDGTIVDANGNAVWTVTIGNPADVNRDGTVDSADIVAVIKEMPDGDKKADVNGDGVIDSADIVAVIKAMK